MRPPSSGWDGLVRQVTALKEENARLRALLDFLPNQTSRIQDAFKLTPHQALIVHTLYTSRRCMSGVELDACIPVARGKVRGDPAKEFRDVATIRVQVAYLRRRDSNLLCNGRGPIGYALSEEGRRRVAEVLACP